MSISLQLKSRVALGTVLLLAPLLALSQGPAGSATQQAEAGAGGTMRTAQSPRGDIAAEFRSLNARHQIWLRAVGSADDPQLLCEYERDADVVFSPDERWIAVNDRSGSDVSRVRLFKRAANVRYVEQREAAVSAKSWRLLRTQYPSLPKLDHTYSAVVSWANDSSAFIVVLDGHQASSAYVESWYCVFDMKRLAASLDLSLMNRGAVWTRSRGDRADARELKRRSSQHERRHRTTLD